MKYTFLNIAINNRLSITLLFMINFFFVDLHCTQKGMINQNEIHEKKVLIKYKDTGALTISRVEQFDYKNQLIRDITDIYHRENQLSLDARGDLINIYFDLKTNIIPSSAHLAYRIKGVENEWIDFHESYLQIQYLPAGIHQLEIKSVTKDQNLSPNYILIPIISERPFYYQLPFVIIGFILTSLILIFLGYQLRKMYLIEEKTLETKIESVLNRLVQQKENTLESVYRDKNEKIMNPPLSSLIPASTPQQITIDEAEIGHQKNNNKITLSHNLTQQEADWLNDLELLIANNLDNNKFNIEYIASLAGLSRRHLQRRLKDLTGLSPKDYVKIIRMNKAKKLLEDQSCGSVAEVANNIGLKNVTYFSEIYAHHFNKSPKDYFD